MILATAASNSSRSMLETNRGGSATAARPAPAPVPAALADVGDRLGRAGVGGVDAAVVVGEGAGENRQLVAKMVEGEHHVGDHQGHVGKAERVGVGLAQRLNRAHQVVAEEADRAAGERRQALDRGRAEAATCTPPARRRDRAPRWTRRGRRRSPPPRSSTPRAPLAPAQHRPRAEAEEGVAPHLALLGRLEQEAGAGAGASFRKAETGVSQSSTTVRRTGMTFPSAASSRACSMLGSSRSSGSVPTGIEHLHHRCRRTPRETSSTARW